MNRYNIVNISDVDSTNDYALSLKKSKLFQEGLVIISDFQKHGRGQRANQWESVKGKNLIISVVIEPNIQIEKQFDINRIVSLSVMDCLFILGLESKIKWPNDILVKKRKIAGILIDNLISKDKIRYSIIGVGLNINQLIFKEYNPKATSLAIELNKNLILEEVENLFLSSLRNRIKTYRSGKDMELEYLDLLFQINKVMVFKSNSQIFNGIIRNVNKKGFLVIETEDEIKHFGLKEIEMVF